MSDIDWQNRLTFDLEISESSPVVVGTWVTVEQVVRFVVQGWTWDRIQLYLPELSRDDIRACLEYAAQHETIP